MLKLRLFPLLIFSIASAVGCSTGLQESKLLPTDSAGRATDPVEANSPEPLELREEIAWSVAARTKDPSILENFIEEFPQSDHVSSAQLRLKLLRRRSRPQTMK